MLEVGGRREDWMLEVGGRREDWQREETESWDIGTLGYRELHNSNTLQLFQLSMNCSVV